MAYNTTTWSADVLTAASETSSETLNNATLSGTLTVSGATQLNSTLTVGVDDTGYDVKFFGATSGQYMLWDESEDLLQFTDSTGATFGTGSDLTIHHNGSHSYISNTTGTLYIASLTSGVPITIGHTTSETTIGDNLTVTGDLKLSNNIIQASDGGNTITLDTSDNVTIAGDLTVTGGDIDLSGEASQITLIDDTTGALQIGSSGNLDVIKVSTSDNSAILQINGDRSGVTATAIPVLDIEGLALLDDNLADGYCASIALDPVYANNYTVTRHNYIKLEQPQFVSSAAVTDACVFSFDAAKGTHRAVDSGSAHPDIDTADAWMKININGTIHYIPCYTDKS